MQHLSGLVRSILIPSLTIAERSARATGTVCLNASATASTPTPVAVERTRVLRGLTAKYRERAERTFRTARQDALPEGPLVTAMLKAWTTATTEAQVIRAQQRMLARLQSSKEAFV